MKFLFDYLKKKEEIHHAEREEDQGKFFTASDAGLCIAKSYHRLTGTADSGIDDKSLLVVEFGNILHSIIQDAMYYTRMDKEEVITERLLKDKDLQVAGSFDIYMVDSHTLIELKSVHDWKYRTMFGRKSDKEPADHNKIQLGTYAHLLEVNDHRVEKMELWYINRNDGRIKQCPVDLEWCEHARNYWDNMHTELTFNNFDDHFMVPVYDWECNYCGFSDNCKWKKEKKK